jgi:hypothetical protein
MKVNITKFISIYLHSFLLSSSLNVFIKLCIYKVIILKCIGGFVKFIAVICIIVLWKGRKENRAVCAYSFYILLGLSYCKSQADSDKLSCICWFPIVTTKYITSEKYV